MTIKVNLPDIGYDEVEVTEILVKKGDFVAEEQSLITVESNKASIEIPAPFAGTIKDLKVNVGDKISTGSVIMIFETEKENRIDTNSNKNIIPTQPQEKNSNELDIVNTTKIIDKSEFIEDDSSYVYATPLIRRLAREFNIDLIKIKGTGRKGRILKEDINKYISDAIKYVEITSINTNTNYLVKKDITKGFKVDFSKFGEVEKIEISRIQKISGNNLSRNWITIPHVTHFDKADITELEIFRKQQNSEAEKRKSNVKSTLVVFVMKAVAAALEQMPRFNSSLSDDGQHLILKKYINIGIAVDTKNGLLVPVFNDVNKKNINKLSEELITILKKTREGKLTSKEMNGGCFSISSIGNLGTTYFTPIVNAPEVAILGVSKSVIEPVWNGKKFMPRLMLPISLSFDHRVIDGADGARFLTIINNILSDIRRLVI